MDIRHTCAWQIWKFPPSKINVYCQCSNDGALYNISVMAAILDMRLSLFLIFNQGNPPVLIFSVKIGLTLATAERLC